MLFRKLHSKEIVWMSCHLNLLDTQVLLFLLYVAKKDFEKNDYCVPIIILKKYLNTTSTKKVLDSLTTIGKTSVSHHQEQNCFFPDIFNFFCIRSTSLKFSLSKEVLMVLRTSYPLPNPFIVRSLSCRYAIFFHQLGIYFKRNEKTPPIPCSRVFEHLNLQETIFIRLKYFFHRVIKKAIAEINLKTKITIEKNYDKLNKSLSLSIKRKKHEQALFLFSDYPLKNLPPPNRQ